MATIKHPKELKQVALSIRNAASKLAPYDTGNLRNSLNAYNTPDRMIKYLPNGSAVISYFNSPPSAKYGKYWNSPYGSGKGTTATIKKRYPKNFDFGEKAFNDADVKRKIKEYTTALGKQVALEIKQAVRAK